MLVREKMILLLIWFSWLVGRVLSSTCDPTDDLNLCRLTQIKVWFDVCLMKLKEALVVWFKKIRAFSVYDIESKVNPHRSQRPTRPELTPVSVAWSMPRSIATPPCSMSPLPIFTPGWGGAKWSKVPCLRKQRYGRGLSARPPATSRVRGVSRWATHASSLHYMLYWNCSR